MGRSALLILLVCFNITFACVLKSPWLTYLQRVGRSAPERTEVQWELPAAPERVILPARDVHGRTLEDTLSPILLVWAGECGSCSTSQMDFESLARLKGRQVVLVFASPAAEVKKLTAKYAGSVLAFSDEKFKIVEEEQALWPGRWIIVSAQGNVLRVQKAPAETPW